MQLFAGVYESRRRPGTEHIEPPFGLRHGQRRPLRGLVARQAGWFNAAGERLGIGDLSTDDLARIAREIKPGELFIVVSSADMRGGFEPCFDAVATQAVYLIGTNKILITQKLFDIIGINEIHGLGKLEIVSIAEVKRLMSEHGIANC